MPTPAPILCLAITPALQRTLFFEGFRPGQVNRSRRTLVTASGKGVNVALALARLGSPVRLVGFQGGDSGRFIAQEMRSLGVEACWVETAAPTRSCHTLVERDTGQVTELVEEAAPPTDQEWAALDRLLQEQMKGCSWFALSGALPPGSPAGALDRLIRQAHAAGVQVIIDSQGEPLRACLPARPALVKLNQEELLRTAATAGKPSEAARMLLEAGARALLVTDGAQPAWLHAGGQAESFPVPKVNLLNPIGSGDCVTAGLLHALTHGQPLREAVRFGLACGSANAETATPAHLDPGRIHELLASSTTG